VTHRKTEKERQFADGRGRGGGYKLYDYEKAWSSISHLILSVYGSLFLDDGDSHKQNFYVPVLRSAAELTGIYKYK
jgi:hypothetical protein